MHTSIEAQKLQQLESTIERGLQAFWEAGNALREIRDQKLYRQTHSNFEAYCSERWNISKTRAYELISASKVVLQLSAEADVLPENEKQARPLSPLNPEQRSNAWQAAQVIGDGKPTGEQVKRAAAATKAKDLLALEPGQAVTVQSKSSHWHGQPVTVVEVDGVIVRATTPEGDDEAFLINELTEQQPPKVEQAWTAQKNKADRLEALEAALEVERIRSEALEAIVRRLVGAARAQSLTESLLQEAESWLQEA